MKKKEKNKTKNQYSFCVYDFSDIFVPEDDIILESSEVNIDLENDYAVEKAIGVFYHGSNDDIIQEYCFTDGSTTLYRKLGDKLELLYELALDEDGSQTINIYDQNYFYIANEQDGKFISVNVVNRKNFEFLSNFFEPICEIPIISRISNKISSKYSLRHLHPIVYDSKFVDGDMNKTLYENFKEKYTRYSIATNVIPAQVTLKSILEQVNHYIATGDINSKNLLTQYIHLKNFSQMCSDSIERLSSFVTNPSEVDLRELTSYLNTRINNLEKHINMYLSDELER